MKVKPTKSDKQYFLMVKDMDCHTDYCFTDEKPRNAGQAFKIMWPDEYECAMDAYEYKKDTDFECEYLLIDLYNSKVIECTF